MARIRLAGGPGHGLEIDGSDKCAIPIHFENHSEPKYMYRDDVGPFVTSRTSLVFYERRIFVDQQGREHVAFVPEGDTDVEAAFNIGRLVGEGVADTK